MNWLYRATLQFEYGSAAGFADPGSTIRESIGHFGTRVTARLIQDRAKETVIQSGSLPNMRSSDAGVAIGIRVILPVTIPVGVKSS